MSELSMKDGIPARWKESPRGWLWSAWACPSCGEILSHINSINGLAVLHLDSYVLNPKTGIYLKPKRIRTGVKGVETDGRTAFVKSDQLPIKLICCTCRRYATITAIRN
jgi:hypothetical protein